MYIDVNTIILTIVSALASALVAWLFSHLTSYLKAKSERERAKKKLEQLDYYSKIANKTIRELVDYLNNTVVNELKEASADGTLTDEEAAAIKETCKNKLYGSLKDESLESLKSVYGDIDAIFDMWIENAVSAAKKSGGTGIDAQTALGIAKSKSITHEKREQIRSNLTARLEGITDSTT